MNHLSPNHHTIANLKTLSEDNKNIISWYPFKKSNQILVINAQAYSISEHLCAKVKHVTIINPSQQFTKHFNKDAHLTNFTILNIRLENLKSLKNPQKFDYIFLESLTSDNIESLSNNNIKNPANDNIEISLNNSLEKLLPTLLHHLNQDGIIFYPFTNTLGINSLIAKTSETTHSRPAIELLAENNHLKSQFYNIFPNHYLPEILFTDNYLNITQDLSYTPLYFNENITSQNELSLFQTMLKNHSLPYHANSYLVLLSRKNPKTEIQYIKFNNYRKKTYNLTTFFANEKYYKRGNNSAALPILSEIYENYQELKNWGVNIVDVKKDDDTIYSPRIQGDNLAQIFCLEFKENPDQFHQSISEYCQNIKKYYQPLSKSPTDNIFVKYNIPINSDKQAKLHYVPKLYIDMIPQNVIIKNDQQFLFDQEWYLLNAPLEFLLYRILNYTAALLDPSNHQSNLNILLKQFKLENYQSEFRLLEDAFLESIWNNRYQYYQKYQNSITIQDYVQDYAKRTSTLIQQKDQHIAELERSNQALRQELDEMLNSKSWKITKPLREFSKKVNEKSNQ